MPAHARTGRFGLVTVAVSEPWAPPFPLDAVVVEQDTSLLMDPDIPVSDPGLAYHELVDAIAGDPGRRPGTVLARRGSQPLRLWAVVHDLDRIPTCRHEWVAEALRGIVAETERRRVAALSLPALGWTAGAVSMPTLLDLLAAALRDAGVVRSLRVWIPVAPELLGEAREALERLEF